MLIRYFFQQGAQNAIPIFITLLSSFAAVAYAGSPEDHLFRNLTLQDPKLNHHHETILNQLDNGALNEAQISSEQLFNLLATKKSAGSEPKSRSRIERRNIAKAITNAALVQSIAGNQTIATDYFDKAIAITSRMNPFDPDLINMLMGQAIALSSLRDYSQATESLRRAQHIAHREDGVYSARQLPALAELIEIHLSQRQLLLADKQQRLNLRVFQGAYGIDSEKTAIEMLKAGKYFARRGFSIPLAKESNSRLFDAREEFELRQNQQKTTLNRNTLFRNATNLFARSIHILEQKYGENSLVLVTPLRELASIRILQQQRRNNEKAKQVAERAHNIILNHPNSSPSDIAQSMIFVADTYQLISNGRASELYQSAYEILSQDDQNLSLRDELFSGSIRLYPIYDIQAIVLKRPLNVEPGIPLYVKISYNISPQGNPYNISVEEGNIANIYQKRSRLYISKMKFRPRIEDGTAIKIEGQTIEIKFSVAT